MLRSINTFIEIHAFSIIKASSIYIKKFIVQNSNNRPDKFNNNFDIPYDIYLKPNLHYTGNIYIFYNNTVSK